MNYFYNADEMQAERSGGHQKSSDGEDFSLKVATILK